MPTIAEILNQGKVTPAQLQSAGTWSATKGVAPNTFWAYGFCIDAYKKTSVPHPVVQVFTPGGAKYGPLYVGDAVGAWALGIPWEDYILEISAPGYKMYRNAAKVVSYGYRLFMEPLTAPIVSPVIQTPAPVIEPVAVAVNSELENQGEFPKTGLAPIETEMPVTLIAPGPAEEQAPLYWLAGGVAVYLLGKSLNWWR